MSASINLSSLGFNASGSAVASASGIASASGVVSGSAVASASGVASAVASGSVVAGSTYIPGSRPIPIVPAEQHVLNVDPAPILIRRKPAARVQHIQNVSLKFLKPPMAAISSKYSFRCFVRRSSSLAFCKSFIPFVLTATNVRTIAVHLVEREASEKIKGVVRRLRTSTFIFSL